ncbi:hypothetical protein LX97_00408 [Nonlabens dokdonensis]|jgi:hypothetical protein|uniref:Lipoprotein n=2 Tax=Nonlabens dokdonensis TaxID=328515 RepID=L7W7G3_NONDD|nr:hypothetical protein [Nonlabens dokdonensis]AGC75721.1 hypothetical protein DDD_0594 [Nonlabens dokdonensis DSW-6]PZX43408.1 hypothetical protein LX97_00408 [Nonlabens dokdonensis]
MRTIKVIVTILFISSLTYSCQKDKKDLFNVKISEKEGKLQMNYSPGLEFKMVGLDSMAILHNETDYQRMLSGDIKIAPPIFKSDDFTVRVYTRSSFESGFFRHGFLIRTFTNDGEIKDERVLASTLGELNCEGKVTGDLKIISFCPDGEKTIAQIQNDGSIKLIENE